MENDNDNIDNTNNIDNINNIHTLNYNRNEKLEKTQKPNTTDTETKENTENNRTNATIQYKIVQELIKKSMPLSRSRSNSLNDASHIIKQRNNNELDKNKNVRNDNNKLSSSSNDGWQNVSKRKRNSPG